MAAKAADQEAPPPAGETLKCQTWVLRVLIHCDGCKKKVKKVLQGIDGVYTTEVDSQQHKVRVTGNVEAETLIKRLERTGKFAELLPEIKPPPEKKKEKKKSGNNNNNHKEKDQDQPIGNDGGSNNEGCIDFPEEDSDKENNGDECKDVGFVGGGGGDNAGGGENGKKKKKKKNNKNKNKSGGNGDDSAPPPPNNNNSVGGAEQTSNNNNKVDAGQEQQPPSSIATNNSFLASKDNLIGPLIQHAYPYPQMYYSPQPPNSLPFPLPPHQPPYGLSYNTAYPVSSSSYYVASPIMPMHAYNAPYPRLPPPPPSHPIKRYDHDDDEEYYGSGCSIM